MGQHQMLDVAIRSRGPVTAVRVTGELDIATAPALREHLSAASKICRRVVVDLGGVEFIDLSGLRELERAADEALRRGSKLIVDATSPAVERVFGITATTVPLR